MQLMLRPCNMLFATNLETPTITMSKTRSAPVALSAQSISEEVLLEKYAKDGELSITDVNRRVAQALAQAEEPAHRTHWQARFLQALESGFLPAFLKVVTIEHIEPLRLLQMRYQGGFGLTAEAVHAIRENAADEC